MDDVLDAVVWAALTGPHRAFAERHGRAARYRPDVSPFGGLADPADPACWADLAVLTGPGGVVGLTGDVEVPAGWEVLMDMPGVQLVAPDGVEPDLDGVEPLGPADAGDMTGLAARTKPGPFLPRTVDLGGYVGVRHGGALVAMAGRRMNPPGWVEISAVCTDPAFRGKGLAARLVRAVAAGIRADGQRAFLHAASSNTGAIRLYEAMGFTQRRTTRFLQVRAPV